MQMKRIVYSLQTENACWCRGFWISSLQRANHSIPPRTPHVLPDHSRKRKDRGRQRQGRKSEGIAFDIQPPSLPPSHPFNPATAASAILMPLNADEVKMCLKEQIPVGRAAACRHGVMNTHTHTHTLGDTAHVEPGFSNRLCPHAQVILIHLETLTFRWAFQHPTYGHVETLHDLSCSRPACLPACLSV